jgi:hypothetical protein
MQDGEIGMKRVASTILPIATFSILAALSFSAQAQGAGSILLGPGTTAPCFDVVLAKGEAAPFGSVLVNRCTGATWFLARDAMPDAKGNATGRFMYRWHILGSAGNEVILGNPNLAGQSSAPGVDLKSASPASR